ncbi:MAG TPA: selenide, water dikinase SelD [Caldithrix abyssi]|uniref:Selenide, water dikinase n=1 Tax=Caldithrix abyssi TaxID=187145 RepID=A0A7V5PP36_CALAY|nr:selenide, water dikinase SelD [Caldithrix abyssi]
MKYPIYLDYNATTPIDPRVAEAMLPYIHEHFGNPSSSHLFGTRAKKAVENARAQVAELLGVRPDEIVFTSGGSESNNYAIKGVAFAYKEKGNHIITSSVEHPAVIEVCRFLENKGFKITYLPVDEYGLVDPDEVKRAITPQTILISIMHANNEVGTIQPIAEIARIAHEHGVLMHSDCAQSVGKIPVRADELGVDLLSVAGHKLYAPKGIGALYIRSGVRLEKLIHGADHERNLRAGTENVIEIVGLGKACALVGQDFEKAMNHLRDMRDYLEHALIERFPDTKVNGHPERRLPNTTSISFKGLEANTIVSELSEKVAVSAGAACHSENVEVSSVLKAMDVPLEYAMGTIRFSVGRFTTRDELDRAIEEISRVIENLQPSATPIFLQTNLSDVKLTHFTHGLGCACKLRPQLLEEVLRQLPAASDAKILVGTDTADDAAVYQIDERTALIHTVDFFTPVVDDPFQFGAVAAANSLSDIYAMGGRPLFALNVVGFPSNRLPIAVLEQILKGAQSVAEQAGISIIGGHTVDDTEPKFGLAVSGVVAPDKIIRNRGAQPGDYLVLTKPLGTGILATALKRGLLSAQQQAMLFHTMAELNRAAAEAMQAVGVHACTDITGFGLLGHLLEMMKASQTSAHLRFDDIPFLEGVRKQAASGVVPGGTKDNQEYTRPFVRYADALGEIDQMLLNDAQTSGGLLIAVAEDKKEALLKELDRREVETRAVIGRLMERKGDEYIRIE